MSAESPPSAMHVENDEDHTAPTWRANGERFAVHMAASLGNVKILKRSFDETVARRKNCHEMVVKKLRSFYQWMEKEFKSNDWQRRNLIGQMRSFGCEYTRLVDSFPPGNGDLDFEGETTLEKAIPSGSLETVKFLVEKTGQSINYRNPGQMNRSPLMVAARTPHCHIVQYLIEQKADVNYKVDSISALYNAVKFECLGNIKLLINSGADTSYRMGNYLDVACRLQKHDALIQLVKLTNLRPRIELVCELPLIPVKALIGLNAVNVETLYQKAQEEGCHIVIRALVELKRIDINAVARNPQDSMGPKSSILHRTAQSRHVRLLAYLVEAGADLNIVDGTGWLPIHHAIKQENEATIKILVDGKADLSSCGGHELPIVMAVRRGAGVQTILEACQGNLDVNRVRDLKGRTLLCVATEVAEEIQCFNSKLRTIRYLVEARTDVDTHNDDGDLNPILTAAGQTHKNKSAATNALRLVDTLVGSNADVLATDVQGLTATDRCKKVLISHRRRLHWMDMRSSMHPTRPHREEIAREGGIVKAQEAAWMYLREQEKRALAKVHLYQAVLRDLSSIHMLHSNIIQACDLENLEYVGMTEIEKRARNSALVRSQAWLW